MKIKDVGGIEYEATPNNSVILCYENDMMNGLYIDLDDDYAFIHGDEPFYPELALTAVHEGILVYDVEAFDDDDMPHCWVIAALGRATVHAAEQMIFET